MDISLKAKQVHNGFLAQCQILIVLSCCLAAGSSLADILWGSSDGYWSNPAGWAAGVVPTGASGEGNASIRNSSVATVTNGDEVACEAFNITGAGVLNIMGRLTTTKNKEPVYISWRDGSSGILSVQGGYLYCESDMRVGNKGAGKLLLSSSNISIGQWLTLGQEVNSVGHCLMNGGFLVQRDAGNSAGLTIGYKGAGDAIIGGLASVEVKGDWGAAIGVGSESTHGLTNVVTLSGEGTLSVKRISTGSFGYRGLLFDGGTLRTTASRDSLVATTENNDTTLTEIGVTSRGGTIDTCGNDVTIKQPLVKSDYISNPNLVHRWSFNGDAKDSVGESEAILYGSASLSTVEGNVYLPGGKKGSSWVNLGGGLLPDGNAGFAIEFWASIANTNNTWLRVFDVGAESNNSANLYGCWMNKSGENERMPILYYGTTYLAKGTNRYEENKAYHIVVVAAPNGNGIWSITQFVQYADGCDILESYSGTMPDGWSPSSQLDDNFMLGHSAGNNPDANCAYDEVRIWNRPLTEREILMNNMAGPDSVEGTLVKTGAGALTLTGENTFTVPVLVETGTLALASDATLAEDCDVLIATNAVLSLASGAYPKGIIAVEVNKLGQAGSILSTGTLDLSRLSVSIANPSALSKGHSYTIATSTGGFTGTFAAVEIPSGWSLAQQGNSVSICPKGLAIILK